MTIKRKSPDEEDEEDAEAADAVAAAMGDDDMMDTTTGNVVTTHETQQDQHQVQHQVQQHTNTMQPEHHQEHHHQDTTTDHHHHQVSVPMEEDQEQQQQHHHHHVDTNNEQDPLSATKRPAVGGDAQWNAMLFQLIYYKAIHGDLRPKAKEEEHKPLYDWMVAQRKEFKIYQETPDKSYLTTDQVKVLDHLQFPWNTRGDEHWFRNYEHLKQFRKEHGHCMVPRTFVDVPNLCHWVTDQRRQLKNLKSGKPSTMTKDRQRLLDEIGFVWQVRNRTTWDTRFAELMEFKEQKGTTVVPQHYSTNKALGKWVAKQREQFKLLKKGEHSFLTPDRLEQLNTIGFVWSMKGRTPKEEEQASIEDAAVAAAKAAVAAAVEAQDADEDKQQQQQDAAVAVAEAAMEEQQQDVDDDVVEQQQQQQHHEHDVIYRTSVKEDEPIPTEI